MTTDAVPATADAAAAAPEPKPTQNVDVNALLAQVAEFEAVKADNAKYREERRLLKEKQEEAAKKAGDFEPLLKERETEIERLKREIEALSPLATRAKAIDEQRAARVAEKAKALSADDRAVIDAVADLDAKEKLIDRLSAQGQAKPDAKSAKGATTSGVSLALSTPRKGFSLT
jgi:chromosome segregation ATPase